MGARTEKCRPRYDTSPGRRPDEYASFTVPPGVVARPTRRSTSSSGMSADKLALQGYAAGERDRAIAAAGGSNTIVLSDNTKITFGGLTSVSTTNFV